MEKWNGWSGIDMWVVKATGPFWPIWMLELTSTSSGRLVFREEKYEVDSIMSHSYKGQAAYGKKNAVVLEMLGAGKSGDLSIEMAAVNEIGNRAERSIKIDPVCWRKEEVGTSWFFNVVSDTGWKAVP